MSNFIVKATVPNTRVTVMVTAPIETNPNYRVVLTPDPSIGVTLIMRDFGSKGGALDYARAAWELVVNKRIRARSAA